MLAVTSDEVADGVNLALRAAHHQRERVGRGLHAFEVRWVVRWAFREWYRNLSTAQADSLADKMIEVIRLQSQCEQNT